jgi:hypothetical protein
MVAFSTDSPSTSSTKNVPKFSGDIYYVAKSGNDGNDGLTPTNPKLTIGGALAVAGAGDAITIGAGTYDENGLELAVNGLELWGELGATIVDTTTGTETLLVSGNSCRVRNVLVGQAGQIGIKITGNANWLEDVIVFASTVGFDVDGNNTVGIRNAAAAYTVTGLDMSGSDSFFDTMGLIGSGGATRGLYVSSSVSNRNAFKEFSSTGNATTGYEIVASAENNTLVGCVSGGGDGHYVDNGTNTFLGLDEHDSREHHERVYPVPDGEGTAGDPIAIQSEINDETGSNTQKDYWGDVAMILAPDVVTNGWYWKGMNFFATTAADDQRFAFYRVVSSISGSRNGGNNWDEGVTAITLTDATEAAQFAANDLVWMRSPGYVPDGEILKVTNVSGAVLTVARNVENSGRTGIHWDHTTNDGGNEELYLCWRDEEQYHENSMDYSASGGREFAHQPFVLERRMAENDGVIARMINGTDNLNSLCSVSMIWSD